MKTDTLPELAQFLDSIGTPYNLLGCHKTGRALVIAEGARILALSAPGSDRNVLWNHPALAKCATREELSSIGVGGVGGIRLWNAPEAAYMWKGSPDPKTFSNYHVQPEMDPGRYALEQTAKDRCVITGCILLKDFRTGTPVEFEIRRIIELNPLPTGCQKVENRGGVMLRMQNYLRLLKGDENIQVDLWHLMQLPAGSILGAPVRAGSQPQLYFNPEAANGWSIHNELFTWQTNGKRRSKIGLGTAAAKGGPFAIQNSGSIAQVYLWTMPVFGGATYVDSPPGMLTNDQILQFWDGFDFCEVEYHSPGVSMQRPEILDISELLYMEVNAQSRTSLEILSTIEGFQRSM